MGLEDKKKKLKWISQTRRFNARIGDKYFLRFFTFHCTTATDTITATTTFKGKKKKAKKREKLSLPKKKQQERKNA